MALGEDGTIHGDGQKRPRTIGEVGIVLEQLMLGSGDLETSDP